jgi:glycosyltransferase involved in cell wall biosynthesis
MRGGEKVLEILCEIFPDADLYTLFCLRDRVSKTIRDMKIKTSFIGKLPMASSHYRSYLPLFPTAIEQFNLKGYDVVISTSHCVAKGVLSAPDVLHISYCFTPMRYLWDMHTEYFGGSRGGLRALFVSFVLNYLRMWDVNASQRVDTFIAISRHVQKRIEKYYGRESTVIYPPVDCDFFTPPEEGNRACDYYLMVSALSPYKRCDVAVEAFNASGRRLIIVGDGPELRSLKKLAKRNVEFLGWQSDEKVREYYRGCRAFVFPGEEDFGITPVEAQACGKPVIAYGRGGVLESLVPFPADGCTGVLFDRPGAESLLAAIDVLEKNLSRFDPGRIRSNALRFHKDQFREKISRFAQARYQEFKGSCDARGDYA